MSGFKFPPPPPPPPQAAASFRQGHSSDRSTGSRGRGRGRGNFNDRGRQHGGARGAFNDAQSRQTSDVQSSSGYSTAINNDRAFQISPYAHLPPGSHVNPAFSFRQDGPVNHLGGPSDTQSSQSPKGFQQIQTGPVPPYPPRTLAGHKRKLDALRGSTPTARPGPAAPPAVPNFGASILPIKPAVSGDNARHTASGRLSARKPNGLGLTPADDDPQYTSSEDEADEDDTVDEEAMHAEIGSKLTFEHNSTVMSLSTAADLLRWRKERIQNFPTKDRMIAKLEEKRQIGQERKRLLLEAAEVLRSGKDRTNKASGGSEQVVKRNSMHVQDSTESKEFTGANGKQENEVKADITNSPEPQTGTIDDGLMESKNAQESAVSSIHAGSHDVEVDDKLGGATTGNANEGIGDLAIADHDDVGAESEDDSGSDSEGPPEEVSSKPASSDPKASKPLCRYFIGRGRCRDGEQCAYSHEAPPGTIQVRPADKPPRNDRREAVRAPRVDKNGRTGIHHALIEQEENDQNRLALQVIKYLGKAHFFAAERRVSN